MSAQIDRSTAEQVLLSTLAKAARRAHVRRFFADLLHGLAIALLAPLALALWNLVGDVPSVVVRGTLVASAIGFVAYAVWLLVRPRSLAEAAALLDQEGGLHNELITAEWFVRRGESSPWVDEQVSRAGRTAEQLSVPALVPLSVARPLWVRVLGLAALLLVLNLVPVSYTRQWLTATPAGVLTAEELEKIAEIRALIEQAKDLTPEELARLREILAELESNELSPEEALAAIEEAEQILAKQDEMIEGEAGETAEAEGKELEDVAKSETEAGKEGEQAEKEGDAKPEAMDEARERAAQELKDLEQSLSERMEQEQSQNQEKQSAESDQSQEQESEEGGKPSDQKSDTQSETEQSAQMSGQKSPDDAAKGDVAGAPKDQQGPLGEQTDLDVKLKKEVLQDEFTEPETLTPKELIDKDTQAGTSSVNYGDVSTRTPYADAEPPGSHEIPWSYRELVKSYFQAVGPRGKHDRR